MSSELNEKLDSTIAKMAEQAKAQQDAQKALHFSQSALNLAHTRSIITNCNSVVKTEATDDKSLRK